MNARLEVVREPKSIAEKLIFKMQPIVRISDGKIFSYELLYRGSKGIGWSAIDAIVLKHFCENKVHFPCFINLSHESLVQTPAQVFVDACKNNDIYFELSEVATIEPMFKAVTDKVNLLCNMGVKFAIDDFGSGHDGFHRIFSLNELSCVKVDIKLIQCAIKREHAAETLKAMTDHWNNSGVITIVEGIESESLFRFSREIGFVYAQGYYVDVIQPPLALFT